MSFSRKSCARASAALFLLLAALLGLSACARSGGRDGARAARQDGSVSVSGAFALYPLMLRWSEEYEKSHSSVRIDVSAGGAGKGMADVLAGLVDLGMVSRELFPAEIEKGAKAVAVAVAKDAVVCIANAKNPFASRIAAGRFGRYVVK